MGTLKQSAMFISGETLVMVVPHLTSPSGPMLLTLRGQKSKAHKFVNSHIGIDLFFKENRSLYEMLILCVLTRYFSILFSKSDVSHLGAIFKK